MKGREGKGPPTTDLLVCFPTRAHLTLMPKAICSPVRPPDQATSHHHHHHRRRRLNHHQMRKSTNRGGGVGGHASPLLWAKTKPSNSDNSEPTSPKVTCAGQIKIKPKPNSCKNWQSVMEEIERIHNRKQRKRPPWIEALGFKKDVMQFLTCLRNIRFDFHCFGSFPTTNITSDDEDDDDLDEDEDEDERENISKEEIEANEEDPKAVFSKWFMVFQENNQSKDFLIDEDDDAPCVAPPKNALLLMRCRSAPAKSWLEEKEEEEEEEEEEEKSESEENYDRKEKEEEEDNEKEKQRKTEEMEKQRKTEEEEKLMVMRCGTDFSKFSSDIAKETWVVGGINDLLSRSKSWKR